MGTQCTQLLQILNFRESPGDCVRAGPQRGVFWVLLGFDQSTTRPKLPYLLPL
jgi:hypothetical protein